MPVIAQMEMPLIGEEVVEAHHGNFTQDGKLFMVLNRGPGKDSRGREVSYFLMISNRVLGSSTQQKTLLVPVMLEFET